MYVTSVMKLNGLCSLAETSNEAVRTIVNFSLVDTPVFVVCLAAD